MDIDTLNDLWNGLYNTAIGQSVTPKVHKKLADEVIAQRDAWRVLRSSRLTAALLNEWVDRYNALASKVNKAIGSKLPKARRATTILEHAEEMAKGAQWAMEVGKLVAAGVAVGLLLSALRGKR